MVIPQALQAKIELTPTQQRAQTIWLSAVQGIALALIALALIWVKKTPAPSYQLLLLLLTLAALVTTLRPAWRRGVAAGILGSITLAFACSLSASRTIPVIPGLDPLISDYIPNMALTITLVALLLGVWGLIVRGGLRDQSRLGVAALGGAAIIGVFSLIYLMIFIYGVRIPNPVENWQFAELAAVTLLYSLALWIGGLGIRPTARVSFMPAGTVVVLAVFLMHWQCPHFELLIADVYCDVLVGVLVVSLLVAYSIGRVLRMKESEQ